MIKELETYEIFVMFLIFSLFPTEIQKFTQNKIEQFLKIKEKLLKTLNQISVD